MFAPRTSGLFDSLAAALCLWAAAYHTPPGAMIRGAIARLTDTQNTARPLLAYYSGGLYEAQSIDTPTEPVNVPNPELLGAIAAGSAIGRGVFASMRHANAAQRSAAAALAARYSLDASLLGDSGRGPELAGTMIARAQAELGSEDAAVLALFGGFETADFAVRRVRAEHRAPRLQFLAIQLPPSQRRAIDAASQALTLGTAYALAWPVPAHTRVSSPFGWREHPSLGRLQLHTGVDLSVPVGTEIHVTAEGVVLRASEDAVNGKVVIIDHGRGVSTAYCHNSRLRVALGQEVKAGEVISESGSTGRSTGPHLHYQLELAHAPMDPLLFKSARSAGLLGVSLARPPAAAAGPSRTLVNALKATAVAPGMLDGGGHEPDRADSQNPTEL